MNANVMFSSKKSDWETPQDFFDKLNNEFHFMLDSCANSENAKCKKYFNIEQDGLIQDWNGETVFCNPPYGRKLKNWVQKSYDESLKPNTTVVMLIPARTDTSYFHDYILPYAEIRFIRGRLKFGDSQNAAPFPSMIVVFKGSKGSDKNV